MDSRIYWHQYLSKLIIEPPDGQSHSHSAPNRPDFNVGQSPLEGSVRVLVDWNMVSNASIWCLVASRVELGWVETPSLWRFWHLQPIANFYYFPNIMTGPQTHPRPYSLIFQVRTVIFGTQPLYPYVDRRFHFLFGRRKLIIEPPDGQSQSHSAPK